VGVAEVSEISGVLKTVVSELGAGLLEGFDSGSEAGEVLRKGDWGLEERAVELSVDLLEDSVEVLDGVELSLQFLEALESSLLGMLGFKVSEFAQSGVFLLSFELSGSEEESVDPFSPGGGLLLITLVEGEGVILKGLVTVFRWVGLRDSWEDGSVLLIKSFSGEVSDVRVFHPRDRPGVTEAASDALSSDNIIRRTVETPRALICVGSSVSEDAEVCWEVGEHGARFASFHVEDELLVHLFGVHGVKSTKKLVSVEEIVNDCNETSATVISEVDEDAVSSSALKNLLSASGGRVTSEDSEEVLGIDIRTLVVNNTASINVLTVWLVEDLSWERILWVVGEIIISHGDNVVRIDTVLNKEVVSVANIGLVAIVVVVVGSCQQDGMNVS
jgi:hypothetical protein